jgi:hypothetical protein
MASHTVQLWPPVTSNRIVQTLMYRLAMHPFICNPPIWDEQGHPLRINKFRNFDGLEVKNPGGLTLSIFPYHYASSDQGTNLTVNSDNAAVVFKPHTLGGDALATDKATCNIVVKLHAFGVSQEGEIDNKIIGQQRTIFETNYIEWMLRQYMELIASALRGKDLRKLPRFVDDGAYLLSNSFVTRIDLPTAAWDKASNLVLHSASLVWQTEYYVVREWRHPPTYVPVLMSDGNLEIGTIPGVSGPEDILYDSIRNLFIKVDGTIVPRGDLNDGMTGLPYTTLDADLILLIDTAPQGAFDFSFYYKRLPGTDPGCC